MKLFEGLSDTQSPDHKFQQDAEATHAGNPGCIPGVYMGLQVISGFAGQGSSMALKHAEKLIFVSSAAKVAEKDVMTSKEKETELLCTPVDDEEFGTALVKCLLL